MKLYWIRTFESIDKETLQELFIEPVQNYTMNGEVVKFCKVCQRWVPKADFIELCQKGWHEYAREVKVEDKEIDERVGECLKKELEEKACG